MELKELLQKIADKEPDESLYPAPEPIRLPKDVVYRFAEGLSRKYRESINVESQNINLFDFVKRLKGNVYCVDSEDYLKSGSIYVHGKGDFDIILPMFTSPIRDRFTIAHEVGHYFLHSLAGEKQIEAARQGSGQVEWEANWFAASFLMPRYLINQLKNPTPALLMEVFGVSEDAATYRLDYKG